MDFQLTTRDMKKALDELAGRDRHIAAGLELVGYPSERRRGSPSYEHLMRIIAGQQLSVKAAATIFSRVEQAMAGEFRPERFLERSDEEWRAAGFSRQKIGYARGLSEAVREGRLDPAALAELPDEEVIEKITALKGFGRWSAEMFLLFSLGRPDVWPVDDLGIQAGLHKLKNMRARPNREKTERIARPWRPWRGAAAVFIWHYHSNAPM
ncbi:MAG: DNA-3-methyladenine glycosylase 2 family protein [Wenzhouxiangellaceae bacterium]